ncbi:MAG: bifunctional protein-serine/threonine kinase/phosphatase [Rubrivivax sp.]|nr:MAG: bifunctional protein-serine/threonine kinase/phosphatase [Rubrivivax sp.]
MSFDVQTGQASQRGPREKLEDFAAIRHPEQHEHPWGLIAAIADGVSEGGRGLEAAQTAVLGLLADYHATPATWDTSVALDRLIGSHNAWLADHNRRRQSTAAREGEGAAMTTLTALVLRGHGYTLAHVGDTRAYLIRGGICTQLTQDHVLGHRVFQNGLTRALGLDDAVRVDYLEGDVQIGDVFVLTTDGVHGALSTRQIRTLAEQDDAVAAANALVDKALASGGGDNATAMVLRVQGLAGVRLEDAERRGRQLPVPPKLQLGDLVDGLSVDALVFSNGVHRLYRVREAATGRWLALKTLHESRAADPQERAMLAHEAWLGARVTERDARGLISVVEPRDPSAFYALFEWVDGQTLEQAMTAKRRFDVKDIVDAAAVLTRALGRLHQHGVIHRDVKPGNVHLGLDGQWRLLDLGVALSGKEPSALRELHAGTPSYMNPEQWSEDPAISRADARSDLFALGVTLYQWLTGHLPYGEIEPYQAARYRRDPVPPSRRRPDVPIWLDHIVLKAVARDGRQRFETAEELLLALERGASRPLSAPAATPLITRDPAAGWKIALAVSVLLNALLLYWLAFLPKG